jgi:hypothetical protein
MKMNPSGRSVTRRLALAVLLTGMASCINRSEQAAAYNDRIITYENKIMQSFDLLDSAFNDSSGSFEKLDHEFLRLHTTIKDSKLAIDSIGPFRHDPNLQNAARQFFASLDHLVDTDYRKLISLVKLNDSLRNLPAIADSENVIRRRIQTEFAGNMSAFIESQKAFSSKYHITLQ